ncbi:MAG: flagellar hook-basal body complex protein FliE [Acidobacteriota bacterium]|nr:flagellar hook-basal body complex protein FliE [Acidobacteriota bacterium]
MSIEFNPLLPHPDLRRTPTQMDDKPGDGASFSDVLKSAIKEVNKLQNDSDQKISSLLRGESQDLHGTVLAVQQADTSFKMMMQVRNRIVEAYKEISRSGM